MNIVLYEDLASLVYESPSVDDGDVGESLCSFSFWLFVHVYYIVFAQSYFHEDESSGSLFMRRSGRGTGALFIVLPYSTCYLLLVIFRRIVPL